MRNNPSAMIGLNGCLNFSFMQSFSDDVYVKAFAEELCCKYQKMCIMCHGN